MRLLALFTSVVLGFSLTNADAAVVYTYTGNTIDQASTINPLHQTQLGNRMSIKLTFANTLLANALSLTICPSGCAETVLDFDARGGGPVVASTANGGQMLSTGSVSTDGTGNIVEWNMTFIFLSAAIVSGSVAIAEPDLAKLVFDVGEISNTHWGASTKGAWVVNRQSIDTPASRWLFAMGLLCLWLMNGRGKARLRVF